MYNSLPTSAWSKKSLLSRNAHVIVLRDGKLCKQRNSSFCLTGDQAFSFSVKALSPSPPKQNSWQKGRKIAWSKVTFCPGVVAPAEELRGCYWWEKVERLFAQSIECDERIESLPICLISLPYLTLSVNAFCTEVQWNLDITNLYIAKSSVWRTIFFTAVITK